LARAPAKECGESDGPRRRPDIVGGMFALPRSPKSRGPCRSVRATSPPLRHNWRACHFPHDNANVEFATRPLPRYFQNVMRSLATNCHVRAGAGMMFRTARGWRHLVALVVVNAVACQALLTGLIVVSHIAAVASSVAICGDHGAAIDVPGRTDGSDAICPCGPTCAMPGCSSVFGPISTSIATVAWGPGLHRLDILPVRIPSLPHRVAVGPQIPRAPPDA